jgi:hypothetical protein
MFLLAFIFSVNLRYSGFSSVLSLRFVNGNRIYLETCNHVSYVED